MPILFRVGPIVVILFLLVGSAESASADHRLDHQVLYLDATSERPMHVLACNARVPLDILFTVYQNDQFMRKVVFSMFSEQLVRGNMRIIKEMSKIAVFSGLLPGCGIMRVFVIPLEVYDETTLINTYDDGIESVPVVTFKFKIEGSNKEFYGGGPFKIEEPYIGGL